MGLDYNGARNVTSLQDAPQNFSSLIALVENALDLLVLLDGEGQILYVSPSVRMILGYLPTELIGRSAFDFVHPRNLLRFRQEFSRAIQQSGPMELVRFEFLRADDSWCYLEAVGNNQLNDPNLQGIVVNARDIGPRRETEQKIRESESRFRRLLENATDIILVVAPDGLISYASPAVLSNLGYASEELLSTSLFDYIHPDDLSNIRAYIDELSDGPASQRIQAEYRVRHNDGSWLYFETVLTNLVGDPLIKGIVVNGHDITIRKHSEGALQSWSDFVTQVMNGMGQGLCVADREARLEFVNPAYSRMTGYSLEELQNMTAYDLTPPEEHHLVEQALSQRQAHRTTTYEKRILCRDGSTIYVTVTGSPRWHDDKVIGSVSVITDLTERRQLEEVQRRQNQYLSALHQTTLDLMNRLELTDLLQEIVARAGALVGTPHGFVALYKPGTPDTLRIRVAVGQLADQPFQPIRLGEGLAGRVWQQGEAVVCRDCQIYFTDRANPPFEKARAMVGLPLVSNQQVIGVLGLVHFEETRYFSPEEVEILFRFAQLASVALDNARLYTSVQRRVSELTTVQEVARVVNSSLRLDEVIDSVVNQINQNFGYEMVSVYLREDDRLVLQAQLGYQTPIHSLTLEQGVSGWVMRRSQTMFVNDASLYTEFLYADPGVQQAIIIPLKSGKDQALGVLIVEATQLGRLTEDDVTLLTLLADQMSLAVEHAHLFVELSQSEEKYRDVIDNVKEVIFQLTPKGQLQFINSAWQTLTGYDPTRSINQDVLSYVHPEDVAACRQMMTRMIKNESDESRLEVRLLTHDGRPCWVEVFGRAIRNRENNRLIAMTGLLVDITDRRQAEENRQALERKMFEAQRLESLGILTGGIAHDFNNLLTAIMGNAELAQLRLETDQTVPGWLFDSFKEIETAATYASDLTRQMLAYSGKGQLFIQWLSLNAVTKEIVNLLKSSLLKQKATLEYNFAEDLPMIEADISQLRQIVLNLVVNASEAIGDSAGHIQLTTGQMWADADYLAEAERWLGPGQSLPVGSYLFIEVADNGCGMDEETQSRIFDPFYTTKFTGRGLGLSAVQGIVRGHRGALHIASQVGLGTNFRVLLPLSTATQATQPPKKDAADTGLVDNRSRQTILIIDDDNALRTVTKAMLERLGYDVLAAHDGETGLALYRQQLDQIDAVMLDLVMPGLSGEETLQALYKIRPDIHVILISGYGPQEVLSRDFEPTASVDFLQKPYTLDDLSQRLKRVLA